MLKKNLLEKYFKNVDWTLLFINCIKKPSPNICVNSVSTTYCLGTFFYKIIQETLFLSNSAEIPSLIETDETEEMLF